MKAVTGIMLLIVLCLTGCSTATGNDRLSLYTGFGVPGHAVIEGRLTEGGNSQTATARDSAWTNFKRNIGLFTREEVAHTPVEVDIDGRTWRAITDEEGYFTIDLDDAESPMEAGWHDVQPRIPEGGPPGRLLLVPEENTIGIISDVDDTILVTHVTDRTDMLRNTFLLNATQRSVIDGTAGLYGDTLAQNPWPQSAPMIYLTASPRQLYAPLSAILDREDFPAGVLIAKVISDGPNRDPLFDQVAYKMGRIRTVLERLPHVSFTLVGDDGENDPAIFDAVRREYPDRIDAIWIRHVANGTGTGNFNNMQNLADLLPKRP